MIKNKYNIFLIPSWYPSEDSPIRGIFIKEQAEALVENFGDRFNIIVSDWGFNDSELSFRNVKDALSKFIRYLKKEKNRIEQINGVYYISNPYLNISEKVPYFGSFDRFNEVNLKNIRCVEREIGKIDLIHAHVCFPAGYSAYKLSQHISLPYVITEHMGPFPWPRYIRDGEPIKEIRLAATHANALVPVSDALSEEMKKLGYKRRVVIPNFVNEEQFKPMPVTKKSKYQFFSLCSLETAKGVGDLLKAIKKWDPDPMTVSFVIGGDGEKREYFHAMSKKLGINSLITWAGAIPRDYVAEYMNRCDAFVLPSHHESFGIVFIEALACGKPVIATKCGGPESIVTDNNGRLVDVGDIEGLATMMKWFYHNSNEFDPEIIRNDFLMRFSKRATTKRIISLYESIIQNKNLPVTK